MQIYMKKIPIVIEPLDHKEGSPFDEEYNLK